MKKIVLAALAASAAALVTMPAQAATTLTLSPAGQDASLTLDKMVTGSFNNAYEFTTTVGGIVNLTIQTVGASKATDVDFNAMTSKFNGATFGYSGKTLAYEQLSKFLVPVTGGVKNTFNVAGLSGTKGKYTINLAFAAAPEPATWAMMVLGFGLVGASLRARGKRRVSVSYA